MVEPAAKVVVPEGLVSVVAGGAGVTKRGVGPVHVMLIRIGSASCRFLSMLSNVNATPPPDDGATTLSPFAAALTGGL